MKRTVLALATLAALVLAFALPAIHAEEAPADGIEMDYFDGGDRNYVTTFNHSTHTDASCESCHHAEGEDQYKSCAAEGCHDVMDKKDKTAASYYNIIHGKGGDIATCMSCHREYVKDHPDRKKELAGCIGSACHPKN